MCINCYTDNIIQELANIETAKSEYVEDGYTDFFAVEKERLEQIKQKLDEILVWK